MLCTFPQPPPSILAPRCSRLGVCPYPTHIPAPGAAGFCPQGSAQFPDLPGRHRRRSTVPGWV